MANVEALLTDAGLSRTNLVKLTFFVTRADDLPHLLELRQQRWGDGAPTSVTVLAGAALALPQYLIQIEAVAAA